MAARQVPAAEFKARCLRIIKEMNRDGGVGDDHEPRAAGRGAVAGAGAWREAPPIHWDDAGHGVAVRRAVQAGGTAVGLVGIAVILLDTHVLVWAAEGNRRIGGRPQPVAG